MQQNNNLFEYWADALQQEVLHKLNAATIKKSSYNISRTECDEGKLIQHELLVTLLAHGSRVAIVPYYAQFENNYFIPLVLIAELDSTGNFIAIKSHALPIIPQTVLEPADLCPISMGSIQDFENFMIMQPAPWLDFDAGINWQQQLDYSLEVLRTVNTSWDDQLLHNQYIMQPDALILPLASQTSAMDISILSSPKKIEVIEAPRNSGKSTYIKNIIIKAWLEAAIKQHVAPRYVWLEHNQLVQYSTIFDFCDYSTSLSNLDIAHTTVLELYNDYVYGKTLIANWNQVSNGMENKYSDKGDIYARLNQLHKNLKEVKSQKRHLEVLNSIWLRQMELTSKWNSFLDFIPFLQNRRLKRLYLFFKQNFPNENIKGFSEQQLQEQFGDKIRRVDNSERFISDTLHQAETDLHQETIVRDKCLAWCQQRQLNATVPALIADLIEAQLWPKVIRAGAEYWHHYFNSNPQEKEIFNTTPDDIDMLLAEHAEYISPMYGASLLAIAKRCIIIGNPQPVTNARFPVHIDYELTKHFNLVEDEADFEDMQYAGQLGSIGNLWNLALNENEVHQSFEALELPGLEFEFIHSDAGSGSYQGSRMNAVTLELTLEWLHNNRHLAKELAIYTCFSAQATMLRKALLENRFVNIPVYLLQNPNLHKTTINIFLPVYAINDPGPYIFDQGTEILDNLLANTTQRLIVIGDQRIFKPELHSASGMFAKHFIKEEEVSRV